MACMNNLWMDISSWCFGKCRKFRNQFETFIPRDL
eukprot:UN13008